MILGRFRGGMSGVLKLLEGNKMTGAGDGNRTHVRSLGLSVPFCFARNNKIGAFYLSTHLLADGAPFNKALLFGAPAADDLAIPRGGGSLARGQVGTRAGALA